MVRKLSFKDPLLGLANVKWGRGTRTIESMRALELGNLKNLSLVENA